MCREHPEAPVLQFLDGSLDGAVPDQTNPLGRPRRGVRMNLKTLVGRNHVRLEHSHRVTVTQDGREVVALMDPLHEYREVGLSPA